MSERQNMGLGPIGSRDITFARKFRWSLEAYSWEDLQYWVQKPSIDFLNKRISLEVMLAFSKDHDSPVHEWMDKIINKLTRKNTEKIKLTLFDGCGSPLEQYGFYVNGATRQSMDLDYSSSDVAVLKLELSFTKYTRRFCFGVECMNDITSLPATKQHHWKMTCKYGEDIIEREITLDKRPSLDIDETPVSHMNATMFIPGRAIWEEIIVRPSVDSIQEKWIDFVMPGEHKLTLYENEKPVEAWVLNTNAIRKIDSWGIALRYLDVRYENLEKVNS